MSAYENQGFWFGAFTGGAGAISPPLTGAILAGLSGYEGFSAAQDMSTNGRNPCDEARLILGVFGAASGIAQAQSGRYPVHIRQIQQAQQGALISQIVELARMRNVFRVLDETYSLPLGTRAQPYYHTSIYTLTQGEAFDAGMIGVGDSFSEIGNRGIVRSTTSNPQGHYHQFRMTDADVFLQELSALMFT